MLPFKSFPPNSTREGGRNTPARINAFLPKSRKLQNKGLYFTVVVFYIVLVFDVNQFFTEIERNDFLIEPNIKFQLFQPGTWKQ